MSVEYQVNVKSQSELDIGGCETCFTIDAKLSMTSILFRCSVDRNRVLGHRNFEFIHAR